MKVVVAWMASAVEAASLKNHVTEELNGEVKDMTLKGQQCKKLLESNSHWTVNPQTFSQYILIFTELWQVALWPQYARPVPAQGLWSKMIQCLKHRQIYDDKQCIAMTNYLWPLPSTNIYI